MIGGNLPDGAPKGYVEFYCSLCLANVTVFRVEDDKEVHVTNITTGKSAVSALQSTAKPPHIKRMRVAQPPGDHIYVLKLLSPTLGGSTSVRIVGDVREAMLTPIRIDYRPETHQSFQWGLVVGRPIPLTPSSPALDSLHVALFDDDWGTRWYAIDTLSSMRSPIGNLSMSRLIELSESDAYQRCLQQASAQECSLVRDRATQAIEAERRRGEQ
jgi:hypothetical protein